MGAIYILEGLLIYIYGFDHNPPHVHVRKGDENFTITLADRIVEGRAKSKSIILVNNFLDQHYNEVMELWNKAQKGEEITKINR
ncbi:DUF4160 domain-containing protein [uncultured Duncaniella sp.]|uniref:DUF4160 domain-containing protein n=1 Tax=uncultured Duncaniella sp. TaxID=2768039 RepID=UPI002606F3B2|nr:DUF4160 domain-containing protein [uncultured Duncaniella sp.]